MKKWMIVLMMVLGVAAFAQAARPARQWTKEEYLTLYGEKASKRGKTFDKEKFEKQFDALDLNKDGILSPEEQEKNKKK